MPKWGESFTLNYQCQNQKLFIQKKRNQLHVLFKRKWNFKNSMIQGFDYLLSAHVLYKKKFIWYLQDKEINYTCINDRTPVSFNWGTSANCAECKLYSIHFIQSEMNHIHPLFLGFAAVSCPVRATQQNSLNY